MSHDTTHAERAHGGPKIYTLVLVALLILTFITVGASYVKLGSGMANVILALGIATVKGSLVGLFFMHLRYDKPLNALVLLVSLFMLGLFLLSCYTDFQTRDPLEPTRLKAPVAAPAPAAAHGAH